MTGLTGGVDGRDHAGRVQVLRHDLERAGLDAVCLTGPEDIYYLAGLNHQGHFAFTMLIVYRDDSQPVVVARAMEATTIAEQMPSVRHAPFRDFEDPADTVAQVLSGLPLGARVGVDKDGMWFPIALWERICERAGGMQFVDGSSLVAARRQVKSPAEIRHIRRAAQLSSAAMRAGLDTVGAGVPAKAVAAAVYAAMIGAGSDYPGFAPLIRFGDSLFEEHVTWPNRVIQRGDAIFLELSGAAARYHAPLTRMAYVGEPPAGTDVAAGIASAALDAVAKSLVPGAAAKDVYAAWQRVIDEGLGHSQYRRHHCGYHVGIGFPPSWVGGSGVVGLRSDAVWQVEEGMTFHVLSWLMGQQPADFVLSDTVLVTPEGGDILTDVDRTPIVIPA